MEHRRKKRKQTKLKLNNEVAVANFRKANAEDGITGLPHWQYSHVDGILQNNKNGNFIELDWTIVTGD